MTKIIDYKYLVGIDFGDGETTASLIKVRDDGTLSEPSKLRIVKDTAITDTKVESAVVKRPNEDSYRLSRADYDTIYDSYEDNFKLRPDKYLLPKFKRKKIAFINFIKTVFEGILQENNSEPKLEYDKLTGEKNFYLCIACPSRWDSQEIPYILKYKELMREHHIPVDAIIKESDAAFFHFHKNHTIPNDDSNILIIDDICSKGGTFYHSAKRLKEAGAANIYLYITHCENTIHEGELLNSDLIKHIYTTDSILTKTHEKITIL